MSGISHASQAEIVRPADRIFHTSQSELIRLSQRIGVGAEGEVYEVQDRSDLVAKIYHETPSPEKAEKLIALSRLGNERLFNISAWPVDALRDENDGQIIGFLMKKISQAEEVHALHSPKSRLQKFPEASWAFLIYVASNIARAVAAIHEHGFVIGDVNPKNILVTRKATVFLLDVDSFQISAGGKTWRCEGGFPEYTPPELQGVAFRDVDRAEEHDYFGLAVVIFQLLFIGRHPFSGRFLGAEEMPLERAIREFRFAYGADAEARQMRQPPGTLGLEAVPAPLAELFRRAFLSALPSGRPQPREWINLLDALSKSLKKCQFHSGHSYFQDLAECPWCEIETRAHVRLFNFLLPGGDSQRGHFRLYEIWKEIEGVGAPETPLTEKDKSLKASAPSPEVALFAEDRRNRFFIALCLSIIGGLLIPLLADFPPAFLLVIIVTLVLLHIVKADRPMSGQAQSLFQGQLMVFNDSFVEKIAILRRDADYRVHQIEEKWEKEASNRPYLAKLDDLRNQLETYENLAQIRERKLQQLEAEAKKNRLDFDPVKGVSPEAHIKTEKEIDLLRLRLERELSSGAYYLHQVKREIEENRLQLQPVLSEARQALAQAEKDWEVASKRNSFAPIVGALIVGFFIGWTIASDHDWPTPADYDPSAPAAIHNPPANAQVAQESMKSKEALAFYEQGLKLLREGKFTEAVPNFEKAIEIDPRTNGAHEMLGYALYRLGRYGESVNVSKRAINLHADFGPYYNLGLAYVALKQWDGAKTAFEYAIAHRNKDSWAESHTQAFYYLGLSKARLGEAEQAIEILENFLEDVPLSNVERLELGSLYLWVGKYDLAKEQYQILKSDDPALAEELLKLIKKHEFAKRLDRAKSIPLM